ncbi:N-acetyltransferase [Aliikangiella sp. G2MR2-5]|uniref:GNAT family N-acetyltransferase n=1 Tax=Aliikangiella sp. G2MR2-5 TaxID=2788943 RepID=UPI0018A9FBE5|nr:GNAT family N-acetyltransferase [Aliikangiella sp. G2MR2-5]
MDFETRKALDTDIDFLVRLRELTMSQYLQAVGWPTDRESFLSRIHYCFEAAQIVEINGRPAGLFKACFLEEKKQWYIFQIQVHPDYQGLKIGSRLIEKLIERATRDKVDVGLSVLKSNPARTLYLRLGFEPVADVGEEIEMFYRTAQ